MTALTFESFSASPRRTAARRGARTQLYTVAPIAPAAVATVPDQAQRRSLRTRRIWAGAIGLTLALHAYVFYVVNQPAQVAPLPRKVPVLTLDIAPPPPPPPPPEVKPKPVPVQRVIAPRPVAPPTAPIVQNLPTATEATPDSVQVAPPAPPVPPKAEPAPAPLEPKVYTGGFVVEPKLKYPTAGYKQMLKGKVTLKIHVLPNGVPDVITVIKSSNYDILDNAGIEGYKAAVFEPAMRGKTATEGLYIVTVALNPT